MYRYLYNVDLYMYMNLELVEGKRKPENGL